MAGPAEDEPALGSADPGRTRAHRCRAAVPVRHLVRAGCRSSKRSRVRERRGFPSHSRARRGLGGRSTAALPELGWSVVASTICRPLVAIIGTPYSAFGRATSIDPTVSLTPTRRVRTRPASRLSARGAGGRDRRSSVSGWRLFAPTPVRRTASILRFHVTPSCSALAITGLDTAREPEPPAGDRGCADCGPAADRERVRAARHACSPWSPTEAQALSEGRRSCRPDARFSEASARSSA